jgi:hypothetical protein
LQFADQPMLHRQVNVRKQTIRGEVLQAEWRTYASWARHCRLGLSKGNLRLLDIPRLASDLATLEAVGFRHVMVFWRETREVLFGGVKIAGQMIRHRTCRCT